MTKSYHDTLVSEIENRGSKLVIHTKKPDKVLLKLLQKLGDLDETLVDVTVSKLSLQDIFSQLAKKRKK